MTLPWMMELTSMEHHSASKWTYPLSMLGDLNEFDKTDVDWCSIKLDSVVYGEAILVFPNSFTHFSLY